jgi:hypothetical protein
MANASTRRTWHFGTQRAARQRQSRRFEACVQALENREVLSPPTIPGTPVLTGLGQTSATISWGASTDNVPITGYSVYWIYSVGHSGRGGGVTTYHILEATTNGSTTSATISGLTQNKTYSLYVRASDSAGYVSGYSAPVVVTPGASPANFAAVVGGYRTYAISTVANHELDVQLTATSFPAITYSIVNPPAGMTLNSTSGLVTWTPGASNLGTTSVTFEATNTFGSVTLTEPITVTPDMPIPGFVFTNTLSPTFNVVGQPMGLQITDASNTPSTYSVTSAPANVSIDPNTGVVNWVPTADQVGAQTLTFQLTNMFGTASITVNPVIYISDAPQNVAVSNLNSLSPTLSWSPPVYNSNLVAGYYIQINGPDYYNWSFTTDAATLSAPLTALTVYPGTYQVNMYAFDANGNPGLWNTSLSFFYNPSVPNPTYAFTSFGGAQYAVVGQPVTIQVSDQNTSSPDSYALVSGTGNMAIDPNSGLFTWTPTLADLGAAYPTVAVTNAVGTVYTTLNIPVVFASTVNNVTASFAPGGTAINIGWTAPTFAAEPIAGYNIYVTWTDGDGGIHNLGSNFVAAGSNSFVLQNLPTDAASFSITVVAVDASGNEGAYPIQPLKLGGGGD